MKKSNLIKFLTVSLILLICLAGAALLYFDRTAKYNSENSGYSRENYAYTDKKDAESNDKAMKENMQENTETTIEKNRETNINVPTETNDIVAPEDDFISPERITYEEGFYYEPLSGEIKEKITGVSYHENDNITYDDLRYLNVLYVDFDGNTQTGEIICNQAIAQDLVEIFKELYDASYPIDKIRLIDEYGGNDDLSCEDNNTSCFNYRVVAGTDNLSKHALGLAIDINPFQNPYITYPDGVERISPVGSEPYADRDSGLPHMILKDDLCYRLFMEHGFTWGGEWKTMKDYQHFQKTL